MTGLKWMGYNLQKSATMTEVTLKVRALTNTQKEIRLVAKAMKELLENANT